jgi:hypothetical protein
LNSIQSKYLKKYIYFLYYYGKEPNTELDTLEKFEKSEELADMLADGSIEKILRVPLIKKQSLSRWKTITTDGLWKYIGSS